MREIGAAFLLHETTLTKLVGSLLSGIEESGRGWIALAFYPEPGALEITAASGRIEATFSRQLCMDLLSIFDVLFVQNQVLRSRAAIPSAPIVSDREISVDVARSTIRFSCEQSADVALTRVDDQQLELRICEAFARRLHAGLVAELARFAVGE